MTALHAVSGPLVTGVDETALGLSVGAIAVATVLAALLAFLYGAALRRTDDATGALARLKRDLRVGLPLAYLAALGAAFAAGWLGVLKDAIGALPGIWAEFGVTVVIVAGLTAPAAAAVGAYLGVVPALRAFGAEGVDLESVGRRIGTGLAGLVSALAFVVVGVTAVDPHATNGLGVPGTVLVLGAILLAGSPWLARSLRPTREPTAAERERLARLCAEIGCEPSAMRVIATTDANGETAFLRGVPGRRQLFVTEPLLSDLDDRRLRTYLALAAGRARSLHAEAKACAVLGPIVVAAAVGTGRVQLPGIGGQAAAAVVVVGGIVVLWAGQRLVYRADADAARRTSSEAVARAIRSAGDLTGVPTNWGPFTALRRMEPPLGRRLERLRERAPERSSARGGA